MVTINIGRKEFLFIIGLFSLLALIGFGIAYGSNNPQIHGHDAGEIAGLDSGIELFSNVSEDFTLGTKNFLEISGLTPGKEYMVILNGITANRGNDGGDLFGAKILGCGSSTDILATTPDRRINWPDGNVPQSGTLVVTAPSNGCIRGSLDTNIFSMVAMG